MIKLGVNSVLFKALPFREAAKAIKECGYDCIEIAAIAGMCEHLRLDDWKNQKAELLSVCEEYALPFLSAEVASQDRERLMRAFEACAALGIPIVNIGPGGRSGDADSLRASCETVQRLAEDAKAFGITLCVKAHVGAAVDSTPTTLRMMEAVTSPAFGVDMDPSHIHRAGEDPAAALPAVLSRMKHIHIRDCKGNGPSPGTPTEQTCGRGDIDLFGYFAAMVSGGYDGPVCLEIIGPAEDYAAATRIAAESYGYMNAVLKRLGAR